MSGTKALFLSTTSYPLGKSLGLEAFQVSPPVNEGELTRVHRATGRRVSVTASLVALRTGKPPEHVIRGRWGSWVHPRGTPGEIEGTDSVHNTDGGSTLSTTRNEANEMQKRGP